MEKLVFRNSRGQTVTVTVEGTPTRRSPDGGELLLGGKYLAESLATDANEFGVVGMGTAKLVEGEGKFSAVKKFNRAARR